MSANIIENDSGGCTCILLLPCSNSNCEALSVLSFILLEHWWPWLFAGTCYYRNFTELLWLGKRNIETSYGEKFVRSNALSDVEVVATIFGWQATDNIIMRSTSCMQDYSIRVHLLISKAWLPGMLGWVSEVSWFGGFIIQEEQKV
ncbi:hypothetical protein Pint_30846 [Pistacia integerrima]|uniref:Uncharacterized protein n=1 Tax=Pistacia integerrima TaxID=434235 RepID=A0ACC0XST2_9ROSI|nr:hypothetical protein Pint_30846 [Pistacia integerrima]